MGARKIAPQYGNVEVYEEGHFVEVVVIHPLKTQSQVHHHHLASTQQDASRETTKLSFNLEYPFASNSFSN